MRRHPDRRIMIASCSGDLAEEHSRWVRDAIETWGDELGIDVNPSSRAAMRFDIAGHQGGLVAAGIGGSLTGKGVTIAPVDDPVQDMASADSPSMRRKTGEWWPSVLQTRLEPDGAICVDRGKVAAAALVCAAVVADVILLRPASHTAPAAPTSDQIKASAQARLDHSLDAGRTARTNLRASVTWIKDLTRTRAESRAGDPGA
ncbi:hypothetical protein [Streptomyces sp. NPDC001296]